MKKLVLSLAIVAIAMATSVRADDAKKADCCADKAKLAAKGACADKCCSEKVAKKLDMSAKGATLLVQK
jgi:hypothetical protein